MILTVEAQVGFSILESTSPTHHFLLGAYKGVNFVFYNSYSIDCAPLVLTCSPFNINFTLFLLKKNVVNGTLIG